VFERVPVCSVEAEPIVLYSDVRKIRDLYQPTRIDQMHWQLPVGFWHSNPEQNIKVHGGAIILNPLRN
jgi:hypothetical protein